MKERLDFARKRARIVAATPELQERELLKLASMAATLADRSRERGVQEPAARLVSEVAIAVFKSALEL